MKNQITVLTLFILIISDSITAQVSQIVYDSPRKMTQQWVARYNGTGNGIDQAKIVKVDGAGNTYVAGQSTGSGSKLDYVLIKYNSAGVQQWLQRFNGTANGIDYITAMLFDGSGNILVTGASQGPGFTGRNMDVVTIKYNPDGVQQWLRTFNGFNGWDDIPYTMVLDASGNIIIGGSTVETYDDFMTIKYNSAGVLQWSRAHDGEFLGFDYGVAATVDAEGSVYTTGMVETGGGSRNINTVKYNSAGAVQWVREYAGSIGLDDWPAAILTDGSGNVIVGGAASETGTGWDYTTIKYNSSGAQQWLRQYNGPQTGSDYISSMVFDAAGNLIITGQVGDYHPQGSNYATVKYNSSGVQQWASVYSGAATGNDRAWAVTTDAVGNVYVTGESRINASWGDYTTIKYNQAGDQQCVLRYNGPGDSTDIAHSIAVDNLGNIYVTGQSAGIGKNMDFVTIKYSNHVVSPTDPQSPVTDYRLLENYPNPFNPSTVISYQIPVNSAVTLKIYDILGNEVANLVNENQSAGSYSVEWDASRFSSGIYFYKLITNGFTETKKMNLIK